MRSASEQLRLPHSGVASANSCERNSGMPCHGRKGPRRMRNIAGVGTIRSYADFEAKHHCRNTPMHRNYHLISIRYEVVVFAGRSVLRLRQNIKMACREIQQANYKSNIQWHQNSIRIARNLATDCEASYSDSPSYQ